LESEKETTQKTMVACPIVAGRILALSITEEFAHAIFDKIELKSEATQPRIKRVNSLQVLT